MTPLFRLTLAFLLSATLAVPAPFFNALNYTAPGNGPALIASATATGVVTGGTSSAVNTTGANLIVISAAHFPNGHAQTVSDSKGNTWTALTDYSIHIGISVRLYYCYNPTVGSGHTFTISGTNSYGSLNVAAFSNVATSPLDQSNGATNSSASSLSTGSITPSQANSIVIAGFGADNGGTSISINSGFTIAASNDYSAGGSEAGAIAYKIVTSASAINPQWSIASSAPIAAAIANFKY